MCLERSEMSRDQILGQVKGFLDRWNRTLVYAQEGIFSAEDVPQGESVDFIERDIIGKNRVQPR